MKSFKSHLLNISLLLLITGGVLFFIFRKLSWYDVKEELATLQLGWFIAGAGAIILSWFFEAVVLHNMTNTDKTNVRFGSIFKITMVGLLFNNITPSSTGGQPAQLFMLFKRGVEVSKASSVLLIKFILFQTILVFLFVGILVFGYQDLTAIVPNMKYFIFIGFIINLSVITCLLLICFSKKSVLFLIRLVLYPISLFKKAVAERWRLSLHEKVLTFHDESRRLIHEKSLLRRCSLYTLLQLLFFLSVPYFVFLSLGYNELSLFSAIAFHAFIMMFASVIPTPGGSGAGEYSFTLLFGTVAGQTDLLVGLLLWRFLTAYSPAIIGALSFVIRSNKPIKEPTKGVS